MDNETLAFNLEANDITAGNNQKWGNAMMPFIGGRALAAGRAIVSFIVTALLLSSCVVHPLPENIAFNSTAMIVRKVTCEARDALLKETIAYLVSEKRPKKTREFGQSLRDKPTNLLTLKAGDLDNDTLAYLSRYQYGGIGFAFKLDMLENTNNSVGLNVFNPFSNGSRTAGIGAGVERQNQNIRNIQVLYAFRELIGLYDPQKSEYCDEKKLSPEHPSYPITGKIGLDEVLKTFVEINDTGSLQAGQNDTVFSDTIDFQTTITGNVNPKITLNPVDHGLGLSDAGLINTYKRKDDHQVIVLLVFRPPTASTATSLTLGKIPPKSITPKSDTLKQELNDKLLQQQFLNLRVPPGTYILPQ